MAITGKKAVFFTFSAILLLAVIFSDLLFESSFQLSDKNKVIGVKTDSLNAFVKGLDQDIERGLFIAGFRALIASEQLIRSSESFLNDSKANIEEAITNGSIEGNPVAMMDQSTISEWVARINSEATRIGILFNFSLNSLEVDQTDPWNVNYYANVSYNITDFTNTASFHRNKIITTNVSIIGLKDPLYTIFTNGLISRAINMTPHEGSYASGLNTSNLQDHINGLFYANSTGPSYLMRLEGNLGDSPAGVESIVRLPDLEDQGLLVFERSSVDYIYFGSTNPIIYVINNTFEDWFRLDDAHLEKYQVAGITE